MQGGRDLHAKLRDECLNGEIFYSLEEAQIVTEQWRKQYNTVRPHSALGYRPPVPGAYSPVLKPSFTATGCDITLSLGLVQEIGLVIGTWLL